MDLNFNGLLLAVCTFLIIGICHPIVIKTEYYFGTRPWIVFYGPSVNFSTKRSGWRRDGFR